MGGARITTEDEAREVSALVHREVEVGDLVVEGACVAEWELELYRRHKPQPQPCPRPGPTMEPENLLAWEYMQRTVSEVTRHMAEPLLVDAGCSRGDRLAIRRRVTGVLSDPDVQALLFPKHEEAEKKPDDEGPPEAPEAEGES